MELENHSWISGHDDWPGVALGGGGGSLHLVGDIVGDGLLAGPLLGDLPGNLHDLVGQRVMDGASLTDDLLEVGAVELNGKAGGNLGRLDLGDVGGNGLIAHTIELADDTLERLVRGLHVGIGLKLSDGHAVPRLCEGIRGDVEVGESDLLGNDGGLKRHTNTGLVA